MTRAASKSRPPGRGSSPQEYRRPLAGGDVEGVRPGVYRVLIADAEHASREALTRLLCTEGYEVQSVATGEDALHRLRDGDFSALVLDLALPRMSGMAVLAALPAAHTAARVVALSAAPSVSGAVEAMRLGAWDYLEKPVDRRALLDSLARGVLEAADERGVREARQPRHEDRLNGLLGRSPSMRKLFERIRTVAPTRATVLVTGETGTGKELVARALHGHSPRAERPFVPVACSAIPEGLLEAELFGFLKGSFTGAAASRAGLIEQAAGGTLFLDEVGTLSLAVQVKLLRVLQDQKVQRVGGRSLRHVDFRLVAASNIDLRERVAQGAFRQDLFYRLNVFPIHIPPLRERREDIPLLAQHFARRFRRELPEGSPLLPTSLFREMAAYDWPGNVRELEAFVERAVILAAGGSPLCFRCLQDDHPYQEGPSAVVEAAAREDWTLEQLERTHILATLHRTGGRKQEAAQRLGISRRTLYRKLSRYSEEGLPPG